MEHGIRLQVQRIDRELPAPRYAREGDAGLDLYAREAVTLAPAGGRAAIPTGISVAIEPGYVGLIVPRSGLAAHSAVTVLNAPGIVDSGYRGEIIVLLINLNSQEACFISRGDRIAQLVITIAAKVDLVEVYTLPNSQRGSGALGHTGR